MQRIKELKSILFFIAISLLIFVNVKNIKSLSTILVDPGDDAIIYHHSTGLALLNSSSIKEFFITLISSFRFEDHLAPMNYLYGAFLQLLSSDAVYISGVFSVIIHFVCVLLMMYIAFIFWNKKSKVLLTFFLLTFNLGLCSLVIIRNVSPLSTLFGILSFIFLSKYFETTKKYMFGSFLAFYFLALNSFEASFISIPQLAVFATLTIYFSSDSKKEKKRKFTNITIGMVLLFLPYIVTHQYLYGFPIPTGRSSQPITLGWIIDEFSGFYQRIFFVDFFSLLSRKFVKIPNMIIFIFGLLPLFFPILVKWKLKLISQRGWILYVIFIVQAFVIVLTGRGVYGAQMWIIVGFFLTLAIADIIYHVYSLVIGIPFIAKRTTQKRTVMITYCVSFVVIGLAYRVNLPVFTYLKAHSRGWEFNEKAVHANAFNLAINEAANEYLILRKHDALPINNVEAVWLGNKIYYKKEGLWLYPESFMLNKKNMLVHLSRNSKKNKMNYYMKYLSRGYNKKNIVMLKGPYLYSRLYLDRNQLKLTRAATIGYHGLKSYEIIIPQLYPETRIKQVVNVKVSFFDEIKNLDSMSFNSEKIRNWDIVNDKTISFNIKEYKSINILTIPAISSQLKIKLIEVALIEKQSPQSRTENSDFITKHLGDKIRIESSMNKVFSLGSRDGDHSIYGIANKNKVLNYESVIPVFDKSTKIYVKTWDIKIPKEVRVMETQMNTVSRDGVFTISL